MLNTFTKNLFVSNNSALPKFSLMPTNLYLNPILDEKSLEEMYKDYPPADYDDYDYIKTNESNEITFPPLEENTTESEVNFTTEIIENDNISATTIFIVLENFTETSFIEEINTTFMTSISFDESMIYSDETTEKMDWNISTSTDSIDSNNVTETFRVNSERDDGVTEMEGNSTSLSTQDNYQHLIITTLNTNAIESATIANKFTEKSVSTETIDKISTTIESSILEENGIPLLEKDTRYVKCFEYVCIITQDTTTSKTIYIYHRYFILIVS